MPRSRPPLARRLLVALGSTAAALLALELGLRVRALITDRRTLQEALAGVVAPPAPGSTVPLGRVLRLHPDDRIVYELYPDIRDVHLKFIGGTVSTTRDGFRDTDLSVPKPSNALRIVGLGDSVLFGWACEQGEDLLSRLEEVLRREVPGREWQTLNTGVPGYNTTMEVAAFRQKALKYAPDLVVLVLVANDLSLPNFIRPERPWLSLRESFLYEEVAELLGERREVPDMLPPTHLTNAYDAEGSFEGWTTRDPDRVPARYRPIVGWEAYERALDVLLELSHLHGFEILVVAFRDESPVDRMIELAAEREIVTATLSSLQRERIRQGVGRTYRISDLVISEKDAHPSPLAHRLGAELTYETLRSSGLLERLLARPR